MKPTLPATQKGCLFRSVPGGEGGKAEPVPKASRVFWGKSYFAPIFTEEGMGLLKNSDSPEVSETFPYVPATSAHTQCALGSQGLGRAAG